MLYLGDISQLWTMLGCYYFPCTIFGEIGIFKFLHIYRLTYILYNVITGLQTVDGICHGSMSI